MSYENNNVILLHPSPPVSLAVLLKQTDQAASLGDHAHACELIERVYAEFDARSHERNTSASPNMQHVTLSELLLMTLDDLLSVGQNESMDEN